MLKFRFYAKIMLFIHNQQSSKEFFISISYFSPQKRNFAKQSIQIQRIVFFLTTDRTDAHRFLQTMIVVIKMMIVQELSQFFFFHSSFNLVSLQHDYSQSLHTDEEILCYQPLWSDFRATRGASPCQGNQP